MFSIWDFLNLIICLIITGYVSKLFNLSDKIILILGFHVVLIFFFDLILNPLYFGDQMRYYAVSISYRHDEFITEIGNVATAGKIMAFFPLFIDSYKSIGFGNYLLYLFMFLFMLVKIKSPELNKLIKIIFLLYPSVTLFSTVGLRDFIIFFIMFFSLYCLYYYRNPLVFLPLVYMLFTIKGQNAIIIAICVFLFAIEKINNLFIRRVLYLLLVFLLIFIFQHSIDQMNLFRQAMYIEDTRMYGTNAPPWTPFDLYRFFFAPFFWDARNPMQILQSCENLFVIWLTVKIYKIRKITIQSRKLFAIDNFFILSGIMYSYVVFNYGTITRYKFPFLCCWLLINLLMINKHKLQEQQDIVSQI